MSKLDEMKKIRDEVVALEGELRDDRIKNDVLPVIGEGSHDAEIMFIGEAPGKNEAATGRPFCGASGKVLDEIIESLDLKREDVYITNVVKDRPPGNRDPRSEEIEAYSPFLDRQIEIIKPKVIATLGRFSMDYIMRHYGLEAEIESISKIRAKIFKITVPWGTLYIVPLFHPAVGVYNRTKIPELKDDARVLLGCLL